ncbi:MAG: ammonia channel protein, partial [Lysobacteraceae bacterium]
VWGVTGLKKLLGADDSLDVFGVHGLGGIVGAILTGVFSADSLGGVKAVADGYDIASQVGIQALGVAITLAWVGVVSVVGFTVARLLCGGLRVEEDAEREGLDITSHGEAAYES